MAIYNVPSGPSAPRWLQKLQYTLSPLSYMCNAYKHHGDIFNAPVIGDHAHVLFVSDPVALQYIFTNDTKDIYTPSNQLLQPIVGSESIFGLEDDAHRQERKLLLPPFHGDRLKSYGVLIHELSQSATNSLRPKDIFSARILMQKISLEVILRLVFGLQSGVRYERLKIYLISLTDSLQNPFVSGALFMPALRKLKPWLELQSTLNNIHSLLLEELAARRSNKTISDDIFSLLLSAQDEHGVSMSDGKILDELLTLLLAGHETTATAISWSLYWLHCHPEKLRKLELELESSLPSLAPSEIAQLPYLSAVCNESLRIMPVAFLTVPREVRSPIKLLDYYLPVGTRIYGNIYLTHRRQDLYPDPEEFRPERFLEGRYKSYEFFPFGGGSRRCIGEALAQYEMKLVLADLITRYRFRLVNAQAEVPVRRGVVITPAGGVSLQVSSVV